MFNKKYGKWWAIGALVLLILALLVTACTGLPQPATSEQPAAPAEPPAAEQPAAAAEEGKTYTYVAISKSLDNPAFAVAEAGAKDRLKELEAEGYKINLEWTAPLGADPAKEVEMIESLIQRKVDGLLINSLGPSVCQAVDQAMDAGIPVVMWDSDCPESKRLAYVGTDNYQGGIESAKLYAEAVEGKGPQKIFILTGQPGAFNLQERSRGFKDGLDQLGVDYEIVTEVPGFDDLSKSVEAVESTLRGDPSINGFFSNGPWPFLVEASNLPTLIEKVKAGELTVVSFDTLAPEMWYVENDIVIGMFGQKYYGWGYHGVSVIHDIVANGAEYPPIVQTGGDIVTKDGRNGSFTAAEFKKFWDEFSFKETPIGAEEAWKRYEAGQAVTTEAQPEENAAPAQTLTYVAISKSLDNPAFAVAEAGAKDRLKELEAEGYKINLEWTAPLGADPAKEVEMIESLIQRKVDGLLINSLGPSVCQAVDQAMDAGIPVVMWDSDCPESKRLAYVGTDNYQGGIESAKLYAEAVEGKGPQKIFILTGQPGAFNLQERSRGFKDGLDQLGVDYEIVTEVPGFDDLSKSVEAVESTLRGDPSINGFFSNGPWPFLVEASNLPTLIEKVKAGELTVVSFDTLAPEMWYVENDIVIGMFGQKYYGWGYHGVSVIHDIVANGAEYPPIVQTGGDIVTKDGRNGSFTAAEFKKFWEEFSFKETPIGAEEAWKRYEAGQAVTQ